MSAAKRSKKRTKSKPAKKRKDKRKVGVQKKTPRKPAKKKAPSPNQDPTAPTADAADPNATTGEQLPVAGVTQSAI
jgi:hypothetical protein